MENFSDRRQIIYIHGGQAFDTKEEFFEYLKTTPFNPFEKRPDNWPKTLETLEEGYEVAILNMPSKFNAKYEEWKIWFDRLVPFLTDGVTFIGWSLGANFIAKYLSENRLPVRIGAVHMVAGCFGWAGGFVLPESLASFTKQVERIFLYHSKTIHSYRFLILKNMRRLFHIQLVLYSLTADTSLNPNFRNLWTISSKPVQYIVSILSYHLKIKLVVI